MAVEKTSPTSREKLHEEIRAAWQQPPVSPERALSTYTDLREVTLMKSTYEDASGLKQIVNDSGDLYRMFYYLQAREAALQMLNNLDSFQLWCDFANTLQSSSFSSFEEALSFICSKEEIAIIQGEEAKYEINADFRVERKPEERTMSEEGLDDLVATIRRNVRTIHSLSAPSDLELRRIKIEDLLRYLAQDLVSLELPKTILGDLIPADGDLDFDLVNRLNEVETFEAPDEDVVDPEALTEHPVGVLKISGIEPLIEFLEKMGRGRIEIETDGKSRPIYNFIPNDH